MGEAPKVKDKVWKKARNRRSGRIGNHPLPAEPNQVGGCIENAPRNAQNPDDVAGINPDP